MTHRKFGRVMHAMRGMRREGRWGHDFGPGHGERRGHRHGGGMRRMFDQGDLRLVVLALLGDQPRHGYELIKEIEALSGGAYAPSPGVIYPLLTMLEEMGLAELSASEGAKKLYALTKEGQEELAAKRADADRLLQRLNATKERTSGGRAPQVVRAIENLKLSLRLRMERGPLSDAEISAIAAALDTAAQTIERS
jgi:DNA-binding PadR family transcriptional regulator